MCALSSLALQLTMPSELKVWVREARGLPVMDRATGSADAYVRVVFGKDERSSAVARRTLAPKWNHIETFAVRTDDLLLKRTLSA
jgi:Ca2+-dependent lipid-binding protein